MTRVVEVKSAGKMRLSKYTLRVYRIGMYAYAHEFYDIARKTRRSPVKSYLLGHALELFLKSFLMKKGYSTKKLKTYSHNISQILKESVKHGLEDHFRISDQVKADIAAFSSFYATKHYEYFPILAWIFNKPHPKTVRLFRFAKQLDSKLSEIIKED